MKPLRSYHIFATFAAMFGFYGIAAGAIAAHAIPDAYAAARVSTAAIYALIHAAVLIGWQGKGRQQIFIKSLFICGVVLFSGSLTLTYAVGMGGVTRLAPIGGTILLLGWFCLALASVQSAFFHGNEH